MINISSSQPSTVQQDIPPPLPVSKNQLFCPQNPHEFERYQAFFKEQYPWCKHGTITAYSMELSRGYVKYSADFSETVLCEAPALTKEFRPTYLYTQIVALTKEFQKETQKVSTDKELPKQALNNLVDMLNEPPGFCYGEANAVLISHQNYKAQNEKNVIENAKDSHMLFFQALDSVCCSYGKFYTNELERQTARIKHIFRSTALKTNLEKAHASLQEFLETLFSNTLLGGISKLYLKDKQFFDQLFQKTNYTTGYIRLNMVHETTAHVSLIAFDKKPKLFDTQIGMITFQNHKYFCKDLAAYLKKKTERPVNPLKWIKLEYFKPVEADQNNTCLLLDILKEWNGKWQNIPHSLQHHMQDIGSNLEALDQEYETHSMQPTFLLESLCNIFPNLQTFYLADCGSHFEEDTLIPLRSLKKLKSLQVNECSIEPSNLQWIAQMTTLKEISVGLITEVDELLEKLLPLQELECIGFGNITQDAFDKARQMRLLEDIQDKGVQYLQKFPQLKTLDFSCCNFLSGNKKLFEKALRKKLPGLTAITWSK